MRFLGQGPHGNLDVSHRRCECASLRIAIRLASIRYFFFIDRLEFGF
jgi:hypothetical protein